MPTWHHCRRPSCHQPFATPGERDTHEAAARHRQEDLAEQRKGLDLPRHTDPRWHHFQAGWCICGEQDPAVVRRTNLSDVLPVDGRTTGKPTLDVIEGNSSGDRA